MNSQEQHGAIRPDEFRMVQDIFTTISSESWFCREPDRREIFGAFLLRAFQGGIVDRVNLYDLAVRTARERFAAAGDLH